jgi:hypothetical protein
MARKPKAATEITSTRHKNETRVNIPTEELRDFVAEDEKAPKAVLSPRDSWLDPQNKIIPNRSICVGTMTRFTRANVILMPSLS